MAKKKKKSLKSKKSGDEITPRPPSSETSLSLDDTEHGSDAIITSGHDSVVVNVPLSDDESRIAITESGAISSSEYGTQKTEDDGTTVNTSPPSLSQDSGKETVKSSTEMQAKRWGVLPDVDSSDDENEPRQDEVEKGVDTEDNKVRQLMNIHIGQMKEVLKESSVDNSLNNLNNSTAETTTEDSEQQGTMGQVVTNSDNNSDSDSDDDGVPIVPFHMKKRSQNITHDEVSETTIDAKVGISAITEKVKTTSKSKKKRETPPPPKVCIDEDQYNIEDRGVRSGNMYLQNIRKDEEEREANKEAKLFRPAVAARLANVKTDLESRVIASNKAREEEEQKLQRRRSSTSGIEWSYIKREKEQEEARLKKQREAEERKLMAEFDAEGSSKSKWAPASVSMDTDSDSSDSDDDLIVPRNYGVKSD
mmetsp:Transcript_27226/g.50886  ORF Transcript_27226/g.50886 Transcript_27226/m.50886 type:complete len:421 (-) Transcript_27226:84-1346(-)